MKPHKPIDGTSWLTIADVAELLQFSERQVRRWLEAGDLAGHKLGRQWRISERDLDDYLRSRRRGGGRYVLSCEDYSSSREITPGNFGLKFPSIVSRISAPDRFCPTLSSRVRRPLTNYATWEIPQ